MALKMSENYSTYQYSFNRQIIYHFLCNCFHSNKRNFRAICSLGGSEHRSGKASWDRECGRTPYGMYDPVPCRNWLVICPQQMEREMRQLVKKMQDYGAAMNFEMREPRW